MIHSHEISVGIDAGKSQLDVCILPLDQSFSVDNSPQGIKDAIKQLKPLKPTRVIIEATGRLELPFVIAAQKAKLPVTIANPKHVRRFAQALGLLAKTDRLDAQVIARFGQALQPVPTELKPENVRQVSDLLARRSQLLEFSTMEKNRLSILPKPLHASLKRHIKQLEIELKRIETLLEKLMAQTPEWQAKRDLLMSVNGVGKVQLQQQQ